MKIWIRLLEGIENMVEVEAKPIQSNIFEILDNEYLDYEDATTIWEFFPGDIVICEESGGKLIARKLVSTKVENRKLLEFIFITVENEGKLSSGLLEKYKNEINFLKMNPEIVFWKHPTVSMLLSKV